MVTKCLKLRLNVLVENVNKHILELNFLNFLFGTLLIMVRGGFELEHLGLFSLILHVKVGKNINVVILNFKGWCKNGLGR